jgi:hypothetical protein
MRDATVHRRGHVLSVPPERGAEWVPRTTWLSPEPIEKAMSAKAAPAGASIPVVANEGRWVVECPDCGGAQLACGTDRRFMCNECGNVAVEGMWRRVTWPADADEIAVELDQRPEVNRHWVPGESLEDLRDEFRRWRERQQDRPQVHPEVPPVAAEDPGVAGPTRG